MISDNYVTGDNVYLRELQNFFFECLGMMSVTHYGAIGDGRVDNYGPLQVAIDDANRRGLSYIYVPYGRYRFRGELINIEKVKFIGNPKAKIFNDRTGEEIPIEQFGLQTNGGLVKMLELGDTIVLLDGEIPDLATGLYKSGEWSVYSSEISDPNLLIGPDEIFYYDAKEKRFITPFETYWYENGEWCRTQNSYIENELTDSENKIPTSHAIYSILQDLNYVSKAGDTMTGGLTTPSVRATDSITVGTRKDGSTVGPKSFTAGRACEASGDESVALGVATAATNQGSLSFGLSYSGDKIISSGSGALAGGYQRGNGKVTASGTSSIAIGCTNQTSYNITSSAQGSVATGNARAGDVIASGMGSVAHGNDVVSSGNYSMAHGLGIRATRYAQTAMGIGNIEESGGGTSRENTTGVLVVGNGSITADSSGVWHIDTPSNAMKLTYAGDLYIAGTLHSNGADYAEIVEWADGNPNNEDRVGKFVVLQNNQMRLATSQDDKELIGVVSSFPSVLGDSFDSYWHNKYLTDVYGRIQYETITIPAYTDENGNNIQSTTVEVPKINPNYDPTQEYIPRRFRKEYASFAMLGKLIVEDDGTCEVGGYCYPNDNAIATKKYTGFYVLDRIDNNHIRIYVK